MSPTCVNNTKHESMRKESLELWTSIKVSSTYLANRLSTGLIRINLALLGSFATFCT